MGEPAVLLNFRIIANEFRRQCGPAGVDLCRKLCFGRDSRQRTPVRWQRWLVLRREAGGRHGIVGQWRQFNRRPFGFQSLPPPARR